MSLNHQSWFCLIEIFSVGVVAEKIALYLSRVARPIIGSFVALLSYSSRKHHQANQTNIINITLFQHNSILTAKGFLNSGSIPAGALTCAP